MQVSSNLPDNSISQIELPSRSNNKNNIENIPKLEQVDSLIKNLKPKRYAAVKPKIVLEVISAQSAKLILALTYLTFAFCMSLDIYAIYDGFRNNNYTIRPTLIESSKYNGTYVCNNTVTNLVNIYSVQITGTQHNTSLELLINSECVETTVTYNYQLWGCFKAQGCGNNFKEIPSFEEASEVWQKVYFSKDISQSVSICAGSVVTIPFLNKAFQPQESLPWRGNLKSYFLNITYSNNPDNLFVPLSPIDVENIEYNWQFIYLQSNRGLPWIQIGTGVQYFAAVLLILTIVFYLRISFYYNPRWNNWLPEQKWAFVNILCNLIFVNPVMLIAVVLSDSTSVHTPATIFALLLISLFGMCTFTALWLMFADPLRYRTKPAYVFYRDKIIFGVIIFASYGTGLGLYFPSLNSGLNRSTLQLYDAWPLSQQYEYSIAAWIFLVTITVWAMCWIYSIRRTYKKLNKISYIKTRYIQLSFRFFLMQATLIVIYFMAVFIICIIYIFAEVAQNVNNSESITAVISSALYVNALLFGRSLFLPLYCCCLAFLFLPAQMITERNSITSQLAATFVVTEEERRVAVINRQRALKRLNRMQKSLLSNVSSHRSYVFCVQLAVLLTNAATEVYYHTPEAEEATIYPSVSPKTLLEIEDEELFQDAVTDPVSQESKDNNINNHTTITTAAANLGTLHMSSQPDECKASDADTSLFSATDISNLQPKTQSLNPSASVSHKKQETKSTQVTLEDVEALRLMRITSNSAEQFFIDEAEAVAIDNAAESELRPMNFESYGMMYITHIYDEDTDTTCTICREISTRRLVVSFRGTASLKNVKTDLTLQKIEVDIKRTPVMAPWPEQMDLATSEDGNDDNEDAYSDIPFNFQGFLSFMTRRNDNANDIVDEDDSFNNESFYSAIEDEEHRQDIHSEQTLDQHHLHDEFSTLTLKQPVPASTKSTRNRLETNDSWVSSGLNIFPQGDGSFASSGLSFYDRVKFSWNQLRRLVHIIRKIVLKCVVYCVTTFIGLFAVSFDIIRRVYRHVKRRAPKFIRPLTAPQIHQGFWIAYANVRERIHMAVRSELLIEPADVLVTGHSLGGGLSTLCAVDLSIHTINKLNKHFLSKYNSLTFMAEHSHHKPSQFLIHHRHIHMTMYNIGSPPVGNSTFAAFYDRHIPDSFRIVNDGDMITSTSLAYCHIGTEIIIDGIEGSGSIIIDPSFVERQFRVRVKTSMTVHATSAYQAGIMSVLQAASDDLQELLIKREDASARSLESADYTNINVLLARYDSYQAVIKSVNEPSDPQENVETKIDGDSV